MDLVGLHFLIYCSLPSFITLQLELENGRRKSEMDRKSQYGEFCFLVALIKVRSRKSLQQITKLKLLD